MCGIAGGIFPNTSPEVRHQIIRRLLVESQPRGDHATGIGYHSDGATVVVKDGMAADKFVNTDTFKNIEKDIPATFILHTRKTTQGSEKDNNNNHPVFSEATGAMLVHNGTVSDETWRAKDENGENPYIYQQFVGQVDTEAILRLVETMRYIPRNEDRTVTPEIVAATPKSEWKPEVSWKRAIEDAARNLEGSFACAMMVPEEPNSIYLWRHGNSPLVVAYIPEIDGLVFASEEKFIRNAFTTKYVEKVFLTFERTRTTCPEILPIAMNECDFWKITYVGPKHYEFEKHDIEVSPQNRKTVSATPVGVKTSPTTYTPATHGTPRS